MDMKDKILPRKGSGHRDCEYMLLLGDDWQ